MATKNKSSSSYNCIQCGLCCKYKMVVLKDFNMSDWRPIITYLKENKEGIFTVKCGCGCGEINSFKINSMEDIKKAYKSHNKLYMALDSAECPFLKENNEKNGENASKYHCEIYKIRPKLCKDYPNNWDHKTCVRLKKD